MSGEEEAATEEEATVVAPASEPIDICPFCDGTMAKRDSVDSREGVEVIKQCEKCGFKATFIKSASEA